MYTQPSLVPTHPLLVSLRDVSEPAPLQIVRQDSPPAGRKASLDEAKALVPSEPSEDAGCIQKETLRARFIEIYWDRVNCNTVLNSENPQARLEALRLQFEKELQRLEDEADKNELRFQLAQDCGPIFIASLSDQRLINQAVIALINGSNVDDIPLYIAYAKDLTEEEAQALSKALQVFMKGEVIAHPQLCIDVLNNLGSKAIVKNLIVTCFQNTLFIGPYQTLLKGLNDRSLRNEICFKLLREVRLNAFSCKFFLGLIEVHTEEEVLSKDIGLKTILFERQQGLGDIEYFLDFITDAQLKACLLAKYIWKYGWGGAFDELVLKHIVDEELLYWVYLVLRKVVTKSPESLEGLKDLLPLRLRERDADLHIADYEKAFSFIKNVFDVFEDLRIQQIQKAFLAFLKTLSSEVQVDLQYACVYEKTISKALRELVAETIADPQARADALQHVREDIDKKRMQSTKAIVQEESV